MKPTIGRIVLFNTDPEKAFQDHNGATVLPAMIVRVWSDTCVNLKVINDGDADLWVTSVTLGDGPRSWSWPVIPAQPPAPVVVD